MSSEIEYKLELGRMIINGIEISADEVKSLKEYIHRNYTESYPLKYKRYRNSFVAFVIFVVTFAGTIAGFQQFNIINSILPVLLFILLTTIVCGFIAYFIYTNLISSLQSKINHWILACDHLITTHYILQGIISSMMFDINNISFYNIFLIREFTKLVMFSRDEIYVSMISFSRCRISKSDKSILQKNSEGLLFLMGNEYVRYKRRELEFKQLFGPLMQMIDPLVNRFEGKIQLSEQRNRLLSWFNHFLIRIRRSY